MSQEENKFKVGDKVRRINCDHKGMAPIKVGDIQIISEYLNNSVFTDGSKDKDGDPYRFDQYNYELVANKETIINNYPIY